MTGLTGSAAKDMALTLASGLSTSTDVVYRVSQDVRPKRKPRADRGKRKQSLMQDDGLKFAAELVRNQGAIADDALEIAALNGAEINVSVSTFRRYLVEEGVSANQVQKNRAPYRSFEAKEFGEMFAYDASGLTEKWVDPKTKRIHRMTPMDASKNHLSRRADRVKLWCLVAVDDYSRMKFFRFVAADSLNSIHEIDFFRALFTAWGLPMTLRTDNAASLVSKRMKRGETILNEAFKDAGGFRVYHPMAGNKNANGKVERAHQIIERYERFVGIKVAYGNEIDIDGLNKFAAWACDQYNNRVHSRTGETPIVRFHRSNKPIRLINDSQFDAAFKAQEINCKVEGDVTVRVKKVSYQLPRQAQYPFLEMAEIGQRIDLVWIDGAEFFVAIASDGQEYSIDKVVAQADAVDEFKALPETKGAQNRRVLAESQKARIKDLKAQRNKIQLAEPDANVETILMPGFDTDQPVRNITQFPRKVEMGDTDLLNELTHIASDDSSRRLDLFDALEALQSDEKVPSHPCAELLDAKTWLRGVFGDREVITENELREAWAARVDEPAAIPLRLAK